MKRVSFRVSFSEGTAHPFHHRIMRGSEVTRAELLMWGPMSTVSTLAWFDAAPDAVTDVLGAIDSTTATTLVPADDGTYAFVHQTEYEFPTQLLELVARSRVVFLPPIRFLDDGEVQFEASGKADLLGEFYDELDGPFDASIERVQEFRRWQSPTVLTDRQRSALETGVDVGYYDVPRTASVADVADRLDCAPSTAGELLRKAEAAIVTEFANGR